jgi:hypothetical protein
MLSFALGRMLKAARCCCFFILECCAGKNIDDNLFSNSSVRVAILTACE